jgi:hypothetical protein
MSLAAELLVFFLILSTIFYILWMALNLPDDMGDL